MGQQLTHVSFEQLAPGVCLSHGWTLEASSFEVGKDGLGYWVKFKGPSLLCDNRTETTYIPLERFDSEDAAIGYGLVGVSYGVFVA